MPTDRSRPFAIARRALTLSALLTLVAASAAVASPAYPLKQGPNLRYLVDQNNEPVMLVGDAPHSIVVNLTEADAAGYFADRSAHGFNSLWIELLCQSYTGGRANASTLDGTLPFTGIVPGTSVADLTTPNEAYFAHVDRILKLAGQYGLQVMLDPIETAGFLNTMLSNGTTRCRTYGRYLGSRYRNFDNIIWMSGNDFQNWTVPANDAVVHEVALGILDNDTRHLQTIELQYLESGSLDDPVWTSTVGLNASYTYYPTYGRLRADYSRAAFRPNFMVEANYEFEALSGPMTTAPILRKQEYWTMTSGAAGQLYGNGYTWPFLSGWQAHLDSPGAIQIGYLGSFFAGRAWYNLVPDTTHTVVTSGYGTFTRSGYVSDNDFLTAARSPDGKLAVVYTPIQRSFNVDMTKLSAAATARWFDPSRGTYTTVTGSPLPNTGQRTFTTPGVNGDGDGGWVLVLETNPPETVSPAVTLTAPAHNATVGDSATVTASASDNVGVVGVQFTADGLNIGPERRTAPYSIVWNTMSLANGTHHLYAIARDAAGNRTTDSLTVTLVHGSTADVAPGTGPAGIAMFAGAPNPFRASTRIGFVLPVADVADVGVFDASGRLVRTLAHGVFDAGRHDVDWDGRDGSGEPVQQGRYFVRLRSGADVRSIAVVRLR